MTQDKFVTLPDFLTDAQIDEAAALFAAYGMDAVAKIQAQVIEPNIETINQRLGQLNNEHFLAYAIVYVFSQIEQERVS